MIDNGSSTIKAGYSGDDCPKTMFPSTCGLLLHTTEKEIEEGSSRKLREVTELSSLDSILRDDPRVSTAPTTAEIRRRLVLGDAQRQFRQGMEILSPIQHGLVMDWDCMEATWDYTLKSQLRVNPAEHPILLTEPVYNTKARREKTSEIFFEKFNSPAIFLAKDAALTAMSIGKPTALVMTSGSSSTCAVPVSEGFVLHGPSKKTKVGGDSLDAFIANSVLAPKGILRPPVGFLFERTPLPNGEILVRKRVELFAPGVLPPSDSFLSFQEQELLRDLKRSCCSVLEQPIALQTFGSVSTVEYTLPDGQVVRLGTDQYIPGEALFDPSLGLGAEIETDLDPEFRFRGLHRMAHAAVDSADPDLRKTLLHNIVLGGGTMAFRGLSLRFARELSAILPIGVRCKVASQGTALETIFAPWLGGAVLASLSSFQPLWFTKEEYEEHGASIVLRKCP